jgi:tellurite methyltransferase
MNENNKSINFFDQFGKSRQSLDFVWRDFISGCFVLDLGCGQGEDSLFLANNGFMVTAVDISEEVIDKMNKIKSELKLNNLELIRADIKDFEIEKNKYQVIICCNVLNFLNKDSAMDIVNRIKDNLAEGGYAIIEVFTEKDPSFITEHRFAGYFKEQELLQIFSGFKIIHYLENIILDLGHPGFESPHKHGVARIIIQK